MKHGVTHKESEFTIHIHDSVGLSFRHLETTNWLSRVLPKPVLHGL